MRIVDAQGLEKQIRAGEIVRFCERLARVKAANSPDGAEACPISYPVLRCAVLDRPALAGRFIARDRCSYQRPRQPWGAVVGMKSPYVLPRPVSSRALWQPLEAFAEYSRKGGPRSAGEPNYQGDIYSPRRTASFAVCKSTRLIARENAAGEHVALSTKARVRRSMVRAPPLAQTVGNPTAGMTTEQTPARLLLRFGRRPALCRSLIPSLTVAGACAAARTVDAEPTSWST